MSSKYRRKKIKESPTSPVEPSPVGNEMDQAQLADLIRTVVREENEIIRDEIKQAFESLRPQLESLKVEFAECRGRLSEVELALSETQDKMNKVEKVCNSLQKENEDLRAKTDKLEGHSRRFNIRVFGLDQNVEKGNPTQYMSTLLKEMFPTLPCQPEVETAHRVGQAAASGSRPMIVRLQRYQAKEAILEIAKKERVLKYKEMKLKIFTDLTTETARKRAQFKDIRMKLYQAGIKNGLIHPATLIITFDRETKYFQDKEAAELFFRKTIQPTLPVGEEEDLTRGHAEDQ